MTRLPMKRFPLKHVLVKHVLAALLLSFIAFVPAAFAEMAGPFIWNSAYLRETPAKIAAAYVELENPTQADDALTGAKANWAGRIELHQVTAGENGVMNMSAIEKIAFPKNAAIVLQPGSYHLMIFDITAPLNVGEKKDITLTFEKAGSVTIPFTVQPLGQQTGQQQSGQQDGHAHHHH